MGNFMSVILPEIYVIKLSEVDGPLAYDFFGELSNEENSLLDEGDFSEHMTSPRCFATFARGLFPEIKSHEISYCKENGSEDEYASIKFYTDSEQIRCKFYIWPEECRFKEETVGSIIFTPIKFKRTFFSSSTTYSQKDLWFSKEYCKRYNNFMNEHKEEVKKFTEIHKARLAAQAKEKLIEDMKTWSSLKKLMHKKIW
jgi:hypothetical protein